MLEKGRSTCRAGAMLDFIVEADQPCHDVALLRFVFSLARQYSAHVTGLHVIATNATLLAVPEPMDLLDSEEQMAWERASWWRELCCSNGVAGDWEVHRGVYDEVIARRSSLADFVVGRIARVESHLLPCPGSGVPRFRAPVIVVPDSWNGTSGIRRIALAWDGSLSATRAIKAALPLLSGAMEVIMLCDKSTLEAADIYTSLPLVPWLKHHGLSVRCQALTIQEKVGASIHRQALLAGADLLVMGGWAHPRSTPQSSGSVTRYMLQHSRIPLLLAH